MYEEFFGFREPPFRLVPDPAYLYLSRSHEEALAHLAFAAARGEGFVTITGEVGTGKTTLCRVFLENLDDSSEAALIFNPKLTATQLLRTICDEFAVTTSADNPKDLIDALNAFLLQQASGGKNVILLVDEAQNLSGDVLEQLRLLSNLETTKRKLIQIILVGQPELEALLASHDLRQLAQRITLSCRLSPLNAAQTGEYVRHRLRIAGGAPGVTFSRGALRAVQGYSRGIPRLINIACDRCLLRSFVRDQRTVSGAVARGAVRELPRRTARGVGKRRIWILAAGLAAALSTVLAAAHYHPSVRAWVTHRPAPTAAEPPAVTTAAAAALPLPAAGAALDSLLVGLDPEASGISAMERVLACWGASPPSAPQSAPGATPEERFQNLTARYGLKLQVLSDDIDRLRRLNLPAVLAFSQPGRPCCSYLALLAADTERAQLAAAETGRPVAVEWPQVAARWAGSAYVAWKDPFESGVNVTPAAPQAAIQRLQELLSDTGAAGVLPTGIYDAATRQAVLALQERHALKPDGVVGPLTKIALLDEQRREPPPRLERAGKKGSPPGKDPPAEDIDP